MFQFCHFLYRIATFLSFCDKQMQPTAAATSTTAAAAADVADDDGIAQRLPVAAGRDVEQGAVGGEEFRPRGIWADVSFPESRQVLHVLYKTRFTEYFTFLTFSALSILSVLSVLVNCNICLVDIDTFYDKQMQPAAADAAASAAHADIPGDDVMAQRQARHDPDEEQGAVGGQPAVVPSHEVSITNMLLLSTVYVYEYTILHFK